MRFVNALKSDHDEIMEMYRAAVGTPGCTWSMDYPSEKTFAEDMACDSLFTLKDESGALLACISLDRDENVENLPNWSTAPWECGEVSRVCVKAEYKGRGLAAELFRGAMAELKKRGKKGVHYLVSPHNKRALSAYSSLGFTLRGEAELYDEEWLCYEYIF